MTSLLEGDGECFSVIWQGEPLSASDIARRARAIAGGLQRHGFSAGDRIGLWLPNSPTWLCLAFACWRMGIAVVALNPRLGPKEVGELIARTGAKAIALYPNFSRQHCRNALEQVDRTHLSTVRLLLTTGEQPEADIAGLRTLPFADLERGDAHISAEVHDDAVALILSTTGTTSAPKLVQHVQSSIWRHAHDVANALALTAPDSSMLLSLPLCGAFGATVALATAAAKRPLVLTEAFDATEAVGAINRHAVTHMLGTDDMLAKMLAVTDAGRPLPSLKMFGHGNFTPSLKDLGDHAQTRGVHVQGPYGQSELLAVVALQPSHAPLQQRKEGGGRLVCAAAAVRVRDLETGRIAGAGEQGEIEIRTPNGMCGYLDDERATAKAFTDDGFFRTGDLGYMLANGDFIYVARIGDTLRIGGYLVAPKEIETVVEEDDSVQTCQVVAVETSKGSRPVAFVITAHGMEHDEARLIAKCKTRLASYKIPVRIFPIAHFPSADGSNGAKVRRTELRDLALKLMDEYSA